MMGQSGFGGAAHLVVGELRVEAFELLDGDVVGGNGKAPADATDVERFVAVALRLGLGRAHLKLDRARNQDHGLALGVDGPGRRLTLPSPSSSMLAWEDSCLSISTSSLPCPHWRSVQAAAACRPGSGSVRYRSRNRGIDGSGVRDGRRELPQAPAARRGVRRRLSLPRTCAAERADQRRGWRTDGSSRIDGSDRDDVCSSGQTLSA